MKSFILENRHYIECECRATDHLIIFDIYVDEDQPEWSDISVYMVYDPYINFFKRVWNAFKYVFKIHNYALNEVNDVLITMSNITELEEVIATIKKNKEHFINIKNAAPEFTPSASSAISGLVKKYYPDGFKD